MVPMRRVRRHVLLVAVLGSEEAHVDELFGAAGQVGVDGKSTADAELEGEFQQEHGVTPDSGAGIADDEAVLTHELVGTGFSTMDVG